MLPKKTREYLLGQLKTLRSHQLASVRSQILSLIREAEGFRPAVRYEETEELPAVLAALTLEQFQGVVQSAKAMRKSADRKAHAIWRAICSQ